MSFLNEMEIFYYVATFNSFSKAAVFLELSKGYVSLQVGALEASLGVKLLHRTTRHLSLTEAGQTFLVSCEKVIQEKNNAKRSIEGLKNEPAGRLRISVPPSLGSKYFSTFIPKFLRAYPKISIEIHASARRVDLLREEIDVAIRIGQVVDERYVAKFLTNLSLYICATPAYLEKHGTPHAPEDLIHHNCLVYSNDPAHYRWQFKNAKNKEITMQIKGNIACNNESIIYESLLAGIGIARMPSYILRDAIEEKKVVVLLENYYETTIPLYAIYPSMHVTSPKVIRFLEYLKSDLNG